MAEAFDRAQRSAVNHAKATATLFQMLQEAAQTEDGGSQKFHDDFLSHFSRALVIFKREQAVERIIEFAVKFVAQAEKVREREVHEEYEATVGLVGTVLLVSMAQKSSLPLPQRPGDYDVSLQSCLFL
jgi:hypothetical protein